MSSPSHPMSPNGTRRSTRPRSASPPGCLSPGGQSTAESAKKCTKLDSAADCKTNNSSSSNNESAVDSRNSADKRDQKGSKDQKKAQDSPAFRLRPRRSTPKPSSVVPSPGKRFSLFAAMMAQNKLLKDGQLPMVKRKLNFNKQKVYPPTLNSEDQIPTIRIVPRRSAVSSITEDILVSPFVQKISPDELEPDKEYGANYLSMKILRREDIEIDGEEVLKVIATPIDNEIQRDVKSSRSTPKSSKTVVIYLYGSYANCRAEVNKVINIVKFRTQPTARFGHRTSSAADDDGNQLPYAVVVRSDDDDEDDEDQKHQPGSESSSSSSWVPFVSITSKWEPPKDPKELNKTLFTPPDDSSPAKVGKDEQPQSSGSRYRN